MLIPIVLKKKKEKRKKKKTRGFLRFKFLIPIKIGNKYIVAKIVRNTSILLVNFFAIKDIEYKPTSFNSENVYTSNELTKYFILRGVSCPTNSVLVPNSTIKIIKITIRRKFCSFLVFKPLT